MKSINHTVNISCEHLESIGCDGNAIELRETIAALVAVAEAAIRAQRNLQARLHLDGREGFTFGETLEQLDESLAALAAVQGGAK